MRWHFSHPFKDSVEINVGQFTQIIGQNQDLKYYLWQILNWYFGGRKYTEEDLNLFEQEEPNILDQIGEVKRDTYSLLSISDVNDLLGQMVYKKGTVAFDFMKSKLNQIDVFREIDVINDLLDKISIIVNQTLDMNIGDISYHTESHYFTIEQLLMKNFQPYYGFQNKNIAFDFIDNKSKLLFLLNMLKERLQNDTSNILLLLKNMDDYLSHSEFIEICEYLNSLCREFPQFHVMIFPSGEGYLYVTQENIDCINVISNFVESLYDLHFMYERFTNAYPTSQVPSENDFLKLLQRNASYLFNNEIGYASLGIQDLVFIKIMNSLYLSNCKTQL